MAELRKVVKEGVAKVLFNSIEEHEYLLSVHKVVRPFHA